MNIFDRLFDILVSDGWEFKYDNKNEIIRLNINGLNTEFNCYLIVDEEQESIICNTYMDKKAPFHRRTEICEFMNRINYELANGNFEMDIEDGEIRFRTYLDLSSAEPSKEQILNLIWNGSQIFDTYYPGILKIILEDFSSQEAVEHCIEDQDLSIF